MHEAFTCITWPAWYDLNKFVCKDSWKDVISWYDFQFCLVWFCLFDHFYLLFDIFTDSYWYKSYTVGFAQAMCIRDICFHQKSNLLLALMFVFCCSVNVTDNQGLCEQTSSSSTSSPAGIITTVSLIFTYSNEMYYWIFEILYGEASWFSITCHV